MIQVSHWEVCSLKKSLNTMLFEILIFEYGIKQPFDIQEIINSKYTVL